MPPPMKSSLSSNQVQNPFEGRLRVRANGIVVKNEHVALVEIKAPQNEDSFWMPPGGGVEYKESLEDAVIREVKEEINVQVHHPKLWYITEYISEKWHAVEFYFFCALLEDQLSLGSDPELGQQQMLKDARWIPMRELSTFTVKPPFLSEQLPKDLKTGRTTPLFLPS